MKLKLLFIGFVLTTLIFGCSKNHESSPVGDSGTNTESPTLTVDVANKTITFISADKVVDQQFAVTASGEWTAKVSEGGDWLTITNPVGGNGKGNTYLRFDLSENTDSKSRTGIITLSVTGMDDILITVKQAGARSYSVIGDSDSEVDVTNYGSLLSVQRENENTGEVSRFAVDDNVNTKFLLFDFESVWLQLKYFAPEVVNSYSITSANDIPGRDPRDWQLLASNDGSNWEVLDERSEQYFPLRKTSQKYDFENNEAYLYYRLLITANNGANLMQIAEWRLFFNPEAYTGEGEPNQWNEELGRRTYTQDGYTLIFDNSDPLIDTTVRRRLVDAFFFVYPEMVDRFNPSAPKEVRYFFDNNYNALAETSGNRVLFNPEVMGVNSIDVGTHELMHVVQSYHFGNTPTWLVEGIADYARYVYGISNASWSLPGYASNQSYKDSYRVTARFLLWLEQNEDPEIVDKLDDLLRDETYSPQSWVEITGKTVDQLWQEYSESPQIKF